MKIDLHKIKVRDVVGKDKYVELPNEGGVTGYGGKLNIRPKYQREFVYKGHQRDAVIDTVRKNFPLNVIYWVKTGADSYEVLDGQQRTISIGQYVKGDFSVKMDGKDYFFHNLTNDEQNKILDYELMIYFCEGTDREKLDWFKIINIAGEKLTDQELRNAVYTGPWLSDAKVKFSKSNCAAYLIANDGGALLNGAPIRQEYLETAISWINNEEIEKYMAAHQLDENADELWEYFKNVIEWVREIFPTYRKEMRGIKWGLLYNEYKDKKFDPKKIEKQILELIDDDEVQSNSGIYLYILTGKEKYLNLRSFDDKIKRKVYEKQKGICPWCKGENKKKKWKFEEMEADHIKPWHEGGMTTVENCQMLCMEDNRKKSGN